MTQQILDAALFVALAIYVAGTVALAVYGVNCYVMIRLFARSRKRQQLLDAELLGRFHARSEDPWPRVTTQLPIYNEKYVVERLLRAACAMDYPDGRHEIQVLDDSTDETATLAAQLVERYRALGHDVHHIRRPDRAGFKAGALAAGVSQAKGELLAIFDADFVPPADFLRRTIPFLVEDPTCGFVQARWGHRNRDHSLLTAAQCLGIDGHFVVEQSARAWNGLFLNFNGTAGVWRRAAIDAAGGWAADTLTEDLALSYRAQLAGWTGRFVFDLIAPAELPTDINAFKSQQYRWAKGSIQTARKLLPKILRRPDVSWFKKLEAVLHLTHYCVHPIMVAMTVAVLPLLFFGWRFLAPVLTLPLLAIMAVSILAPSALYSYAQRAAYPDWWRRLSLLPVLNVLGVGLAVNNARAVLSALVSREPGVFVRTPKVGDSGKRRENPAGSYRIGPTAAWLLEIALGLWAAFGFVAYIKGARFLVGTVLLLHAAGFLTVGTLSALHGLRHRTRDSVAPRTPPAVRDGHLSAGA